MMFKFFGFTVNIAKVTTTPVVDHSDVPVSHRVGFTADVTETIVFTDAKFPVGFRK